MSPLRLLLAPLALLALTAPPAPALAGSVACQSVNGHTVCMEGPGTLSCTTVNGRTACRTGPADAAVPELSLPDLSDLPDIAIEMPGMSDVPEGTPAPDGLGTGDWFAEDLVIERDGTGLRIRTGELDLHLEEPPGGHAGRQP